jgi:hypothetical protein
MVSHLVGSYPFGVTATDIERSPNASVKYSSVHCFEVALMGNPCITMGRATRTILENSKAVGGSSNVSRHSPFKSDAHVRS